MEFTGRCEIDPGIDGMFKIELEGIMRLSDLVPWNWGSSKVPVNIQKDTHPVSALQNEMNQVFDRFFSGTPFFDPSGKLEGVFVPKVNVTEADSQITVTAELPGMEKDDVKLTLTDEYLTLSGEKRSESEKTENGASYYEASYGSFRRVVPLDVEIDADKIHASMNKGVLTVTLPKKAGTRRTEKTISIQAS